MGLHFSILMPVQLELYFVNQDCVWSISRKAPATRIIAEFWLIQPDAFAIYSESHWYLPLILDKMPPVKVNAYLHPLIIL